MKHYKKQIKFVDPDVNPDDQPEFDGQVYAFDDDYQPPANFIPVDDLEKETILESKRVEPDFYICSPWQLRKVLNREGLRGQVEQLVKTSTDQSLIDGFQYATFFKSNEPPLLGMGAALGKTPEQIKELVKLAATL